MKNALVWTRRFRRSDQSGINMVDLMMWLVIAALLLAAAIQGIGYYQKAAGVYTLKNDIAAVGTSAVTEAGMANGVITKNVVSAGLANTKLSQGVKATVETTSTGEAFARVTSETVTDTDAIYLFKSCGGMQVGVNLVPKKTTPAMSDCGISDSPTLSTLITDGSAVMTSIWDTSISGCSTISLPMGGHNVSINWGDGKTSTSPSHTYTDTPGPHKVTVNGTFASWNLFTAPGTLKCLTQITGWGETGTTSLANGFYDAVNLTEVKQIPSTTTNMSGAFMGATKFNGDVSKWNTSNVRYMDKLFMGATSFNQPVNSWNTSSVTDMSSAFYNANSFNQPLTNWDTSKVTDMSSMFRNAASFDSSIGNWNVGNVVRMGDMFNNALVFNQPLPVNWNTTKVTNMVNMFNSAKKFNQNISAWDVNAVTSWSGFSIYSPLTEANRPAKFKSF